MSKVGPLIFVAALGIVGLLLAADVGGISSRITSNTRRWWSAGPIRSQLKPAAWTNIRWFGVSLAALALALLVGLIFAKK